MASTTAVRKTREDIKKEKDLLEARKAGTVAPEKDEEGNEINPHIPQYIAQAPWYLGTNGAPSLSHQKIKPSNISGEEKLRNWYTRGETKGTTALKWRKGACTNCGSATHESKACFERPRKLGAKFTNDDIKPDEIVQDIKLDWEGKHDRWNGYDSSNHTKLLEEYEKVDQERRRKKAEELQNNFMTEPDPSHERYPHNKESEDPDKPKLADDDDIESEGYNNAPMAKVDPKTRTTIRNLRIREDTAKYLYNLDVNSAHYDPKSRSMRENPLPHVNADSVAYRGDIHARTSGDTKGFDNINSFAFEAYERGQEVHMQAAPSQAALMYKSFQEKKETLKKQQNDALLQKYGGSEHLEKPKEYNLSASEVYVEYTRDGKLLKGEKVIPKSKWEEDVYIGNHTSVWGSYWESGKWGYKCCHSIVKNSYCTGDAGIQARKEVITAMKDNINNKEQKDEEHRQIVDKIKVADQTAKLKKDPYAEQKEVVLDQKKLDKAIREERERSSKKADGDDRKRKYNSASGGYGTDEMAPEELEAYKRSKLSYEDPMYHFQDSDK